MRRVFGIHFADHVFDNAVPVDYKSSADGTHVIFAKHHFLSPNPIALHDLLIRISDQGERQVEFIDKLFVRFLGIRADAYYLEAF